MRVLLLLLFSCSSFAGFEFKYGGSARSYPGVGGAMEADFGYSMKLWGDTSSPWYGMIRPGVKGSSTIVVHDYDTNIYFYPVSFIGFGAGQIKMTSEYNEFQWYDCEEVRCVGTMTKDYLSAKIALGYGRWLVTHSYSEFRNSYSDEDGTLKPVAEYQWTTAVNPLNERSQRKTYLLGYKWDKDLIAVAADYRTYEFSEQFYRFTALIFQKNIEKFSLVIGVGGQDSTETGPGTVMVIRLTHNLLPSMALF